MTASARSPQSWHQARTLPAETAPVWSGPVLNPGVALPVYGDDAWDLSAACCPPSQTALAGGYRASFAPISLVAPRPLKGVNPAVYAGLGGATNDAASAPALDLTLSPELAEAHKHACWLILNGVTPSVPAAVAPLAPNSLNNTFNGVRWWLWWTTALGKSPAELNMVEVTGFFRLVAEKTSPENAANVASGLRRLHLYREDLVIPLTPQHFRYSLPRKKFTANVTQVIPETEFAPMLDGALFYVQHASAEIIGSARRLAELRAAAAANPRANPGDLTDRVSEVVASFRQQRQPIPSSPKRPTEPDWHHLGLLAGTAVLAVPNVKKIVYDAVDELGLAPMGLGFDPAVYPTLGAPWRDRPLAPGDVNNEIHWLVHACLIVILMGTGMRLSELLATDRDGEFTTTSASGAVRYRIRSRVMKGQGIGGGPDNDWLCMPAAHDALRVLRDLEAVAVSLPTRAQTRKCNQVTDLEFVPGPTVGEMLTNLGASPTSVSRFPEHLNRIWGTPASPWVTPVNDKLVQVHSRSLRRTATRYIAARPFGTVAVMRQMKHLNPLTSEAYVAGPQAGFAHEVAAQIRVNTAIAAMDAAAAIQDGVPVIASDASRSLLRSVDATMIITEREADALFKRMGRPVHDSGLNLCLYDASVAKCWTGTPMAERGGPRPTVCQPAQCTNAVIGPQHAPAWQEDLDGVRVEITRAKTLKPRPTDYIRQLNLRRDNAEQVLGDLDGEPDGS